MGNNMNMKLNWSRIFTMIGAILAFSIGSGFATGQEIVQFITAYGYQGLLVGLIFLIIFGYSNYAYARAGYIEKFHNGSDVYRYFCGKNIGTAYDFFSVFFCYMSFIVMIGGASATLQQQYNVPLAIGGIIITILACITVIFGLNSLVNVIGKIGPIIVIICMVIGIYTFIVDGSQIPEGVRLVTSGEVKVMKASTNWLLAGGSYAGFCMLWFGGFMAKLGSNNDQRELNIAVVIAAVLNTLAIVISGYALTANVALIADAQIPNIVLVKKLIPAFASIFSVVVFAAIYTTSVPLLWTAVSRFAEEKSKKFYIITMILGVLGYLVAMKIPFNRLLNLVYVVNGYAGIVLLGFIIVKNIRLRMASK
jgi:uncharacterized membrane protein YkvI